MERDWRSDFWPGHPSRRLGRFPVTYTFLLKSAHPVESKRVHPS